MPYPRYITVNELITQLSLIAGQEQESFLEGLILAASDVVNEYVQGNVRPQVEEGEPEAEVYPRIKQATKMLAAEWYLNRETETQGLEKGVQGHGYLPQAVQSILYPLRSPVVL